MYSDYSTFRNLVQPVTIATQKGAVDLLWFPGNVSSAVLELENAVYPVHAHAVAVTGGSGDLDWSSVERAKNRIRELTQAQAVAITNGGSSWLHEFIRHLSHNERFDVAFHQTRFAIEPEMTGPILWSSDPLTRATGIKNFSRDLVGEGLLRLDGADKLLLDDYVASSLNLKSGLHPAELVLGNLSVRMEGLDWLHESGGATVVAGVSRAVEAARLGEQRRRKVSKPLMASSASSASPRFLQVDAWAEDADGGHPTKLEDTFICGMMTSLRVHVGPDLQDGHLVLRDIFPEHELPPSQNGHLLVVAFFEPQLMESPQVKTLFLPPTGQSPPCSFQFRVKDGITEIEGRVTVLHENRVLQTGLVRGRALPRRPAGGVGVTREGESAEQTDSKIRFIVSNSVHRAIADLDRRSRFDAALVLNHLDNRPGLQGIAGNRAGFVWLDDTSMQNAKNAIYEALDTGDWDYKEYNGLHAPGTTELLRRLAIKGSDLYVFVARHFSKSVIEAERLQIAMAKDHARFPVEFFYRYSAPADDAPVCPNAEEALRTGVCLKKCKGRDAVPSSVMCPLGFWGLSKVIKWHAFFQELALELPANVAVRLDIDKAPTSDEVVLDGACLFGYSKKIDKAEENCIAGFVKRVGSGPGAPIMIDSWTDWKSQVQKRDPSLLMLLVHTQTGRYSTVLEMGPPEQPQSEEESLLRMSSLTREYVIGPKLKGAPIVLLLGCTTETAKLPFDTVASAFEQRGGAGIIVATSNLIYGPKAVEVAEVFLEKLKAVKNGQTFGEVMLSVRRSALADGITMILCISSYGDADWKLVKQEV